jgi:hypothetical protein
MNDKIQIKTVITRTEVSNEGKLLIYTDVSDKSYIASTQVRSYIENSKYSVIGNMYELTISSDIVEFIKYVNGTLDTIKQKSFEQSEQKNIVTLSMLLDCAHKSKSLASIQTQIIEKTDEYVLVQAVVNGNFTSYGHASKENVKGDKIKNLVAVAETRAIVRALKLATNYGEKVLDEDDATDDN